MHQKEVSILRIAPDLLSWYVDSGLLLMDLSKVHSTSWVFWQQLSKYTDKEGCKEVSATKTLEDIKAGEYYEHLQTTISLSTAGQILGDQRYPCRISRNRQ